MNYPIWDLPAGGLLIAAVAIFHVFISHFAVGGGVFLVFLERRARLRDDAGLLGYVKLHSRFFVLLTLVAGAVSGVGIWFTIGLVNPQATSTLIQTFVWVWAMEWTFFATEIAAAMVYYYGWDHLKPKTHLAFGWVYLISAWMSLFIINGILTFMLTPGEWLSTRSLADGFFNPTFWPSLLARTLVAAGLAGLYALLTTAWSKDEKLRKQVANYASLRWVLPSAVLLPGTLAWYLWAAQSAGVPVAKIFGLTAGDPLSVLLSALNYTAASGYPLAQKALFLLVVSAVLLVLATVVIGIVNTRLLNPYSSFLVLMLGLVCFGSGEWIREGLRKPYVIGEVLFVNGILRPLPESPAWTGIAPNGGVHYALDSIQESGLLRVSKWIDPALRNSGDGQAAQIARGEAVFSLLCSSCHTADGHLGIEALVRGKPSGALETTLQRLALPVGPGGEPVAWNSPTLRLSTWMDRSMPPFAGTQEEARSLALYLDSLDGEFQSPESSSAGQRIFDEHCIFCHAADAGFPLAQLSPGRTAAEFFEKIGQLPDINPVMPPFEGTDEERMALASYLEELVKNGSEEVE